MLNTEAVWRALLAMQRHPWEQGVASHAALDTGDERLAMLMAHDAVVRQDERGRLASTGDIGLVNSAACGEAVVRLADSGDPGALQALERQHRWIAHDCPRGDSGELFHLEGRTQVWVDTVYMVVPFLTAVGDYQAADMQYRLHRQHLWNAGTGLFGHMHDVATGMAVRDAAWASGNGWVAAGLARSLRLAGDTLDARVRQEWQDDVAALLSACASHVRTDGRFHDVLDDPTAFIDGTAGLMLAYAAFTGVAEGWLDSNWAEAAEQWFAGATAFTGADGLIREVCGSPHFDRQGTSAEAQAFALLAHAARARLA